MAKKYEVEIMKKIESSILKKAQEYANRQAPVVEDMETIDGRIVADSSHYDDAAWEDMYMEALYRISDNIADMEIN